MTIAAEFVYLRPDSLEEAVGFLAEHPGDVRVLAGGTDLVAWLRDDMIAPDAVVDIKRIDGLGEIVDEGDAVSIGSLATFSELIESDLVRTRLPLLAEAARTVGSTGIRNRATLVGNICSAVPSCDAGPALLVYDAAVEVVGPDGARRIPIGEWFKGPRETALERDEIATRVIVPVPAGPHGSAYARLSRYRGEDLAQASVAVVVTEDWRYSVAFGAVAATPLRAARIERVLQGHALTDDLIAAAIALVHEEVSPITDIRASREYRLHMCQVMLRRGLVAAAERLVGHGPPIGTSLV